MPPRKSKSGDNRRMIGAIVVAALVSFCLAGAYALLHHETPDKPTEAERSEAERIVELCAGGYSDQVTSEVEAGLTEYLTHVHAKTQVGHNSLGAIIKKITAGHSGEAFFREYQECVKSQTIMHLWPNGHVPPEYLPTVQAAYSEEDRRADALTIQQTLLDHGAYTTRIFEPADGKYSATVTPDSIDIWNTEIPKPRTSDDVPGQPKIFAYHADLRSLVPATTVEHNEGQTVIRLRCVSGECIEVTQEVATGKGITTPAGPPFHWESMILHFDYNDSDQEKKALLEFRRALARLISPTNSDKEVCEAAAHDPLSPQCDKIAG